MYRILRERKVREYTRGRHGGTATAANVEEEREAWKVHFEKVSKTRSEVHERVWQSICLIHHCP